ncbi:uncharacterized protein LOC129750669 isoform X2 [Uranotaenia lowii]|uniref:uncharacterized protein LOC129750669 isoform X2 n=1 Tax=Uranotaenia lowii TaxID=190385 RepID=UPI002478C4F3|nr:uncharacterized protein LOC129750669 isoform X2 [Uranotaenia lowii]
MASQKQNPEEQLLLQPGSLYPSKNRTFSDSRGRPLWLTRNRDPVAEFQQIGHKVARRKINRAVDVVLLDLVMVQDRNLRRNSNPVVFLTRRPKQQANEIKPWIRIFQVFMVTTEKISSSADEMKTEIVVTDGMRNHDDRGIFDLDKIELNSYGPQIPCCQTRAFNLLSNGIVNQNKSFSSKLTALNDVLMT